MTNEIEKVSDCCSARVHDPAGGEGTAICMGCKEHCDAVYPPCPEGICDGSGLVGTTYYDHDSHNYIPDGDEPCLCQKSDDEHEPEID